MTRSRYEKFFQNKSCIITGASSGIGKLLAQRLAEYGANMVLVSRTESELKDSCNSCIKIAKKKGHESYISYTIADLSDMQQASKAIDYALHALGTIDVLVANAGMSMFSKIADSNEVIYHKMLEANYFSAVNIILQALPYLKQNNATLAVITSIQSLIGVPCHAAYVAAKHALGGFIESLEMEEKDINVVEIIPGWVSGTNIRAKALDGHGQPTQDRSAHAKRHSRSSVTVEECVEAILEGIIKKKRLVFRPKFWQNILFVKYSMRKYLHWLIVRRQNYSSQ